MFTEMLLNRAKLPLPSDRMAMGVGLGAVIRRFSDLSSQKQPVVDICIAGAGPCGTVLAQLLCMFRVS